MLEMVTGSLVSSTALITSRASFLAPCGVMVPDNLCPPSMINLDMLYLGMKGDTVFLFYGFDNLLFQADDILRGGCA